MDDLDRMIDKFKKNNPELAKTYDMEYEEFKVGALLKMARHDAGFTQGDIAKKIHTNKTNISRLENHAEDVKLSTIAKYLQALGKKFSIQVY